MPDLDNRPTQLSSKATSQIEQFARTLCKQLAGQGHEALDSEEVIWGLANILKVLADITARQYDSVEQVDNSTQLE